MKSIVASKHGVTWPDLRMLCAGVFVLSVLATGSARACVGTDCMQIWSTQEGGGALAVFWDFEHKKVQTARFFCSPSGTCIYNTIDPGFMTPPEAPPAGYHALVDGTKVSIEAVSLDPAMNLMIEGNQLEENVPVMLGTAPTLHVHPTWQLRVPEEVEDDFVMTFILTTDSASYVESQEYSVVISNLPTPTPSESTPTPTPTATPSPTGCPADLNEDEQVTVDELVAAVNAALGMAPVEPIFDLDGDGSVTISELVTAVDACLDGCPGVALAPTLENIQRTIFSPRCSIPSCHDSTFQSGHLVLEPDQSYNQLVGVEPDIFAARELGFLRVDPGNPENSFLLVKIEGPPLGQGSRMPLTGGLLTPGEEQLIRDWIALGALGGSRSATRAPHSGPPFEFHRSAHHEDECREPRNDSTHPNDRRIAGGCHFVRFTHSRSPRLLFIASPPKIRFTLRRARPHEPSSRGLPSLFLCRYR